MAPLLDKSRLGLNVILNIAECANSCACLSLKLKTLNRGVVFFNGSVEFTCVSC